MAVLVLRIDIGASSCALPRKKRKPDDEREFGGVHEIGAKDFSQNPFRSSWFLGALK